jgi:hypothetical protein
MKLCGHLSRKMNELFIGMDEVRAYIDDLLLITSGTYEEHLAKLGATTPRGGTKGKRRIKVLYRSLASVTGLLGTVFTYKVHAIQKIAEPTNKKQLRAL